MSLASRRRLMIKNTKAEEPEIDWSKSITIPNPKLIIDREGYTLPSQYDPDEFKYIFIFYYSTNWDYVIYSKHPFYAELMSDGVHYSLRTTNGNTTLTVHPKRGTWFTNPTTRYTIDGVEYGGSNSNYLQIKPYQCNYPVFPIDANGNLII